jgi:hypothetical protein
MGGSQLERCQIERLDLHGDVRALVMKSNRKTRSGAAQKPTSIRYLAGAALVLLAAFGIGIAIREFRFSFWQKHRTQAAKAIQSADTPKTKRPPKGPESQSIQELSPIEEESAKPEPGVSLPAGPPTSQEAGGQSPAEAQTEMAAAPPDQDQSSNNEEAAAKERRGREALALIGHDPAADEVWIEVINDPSVSANARSNLIEDLNEDGLQYRNLTLNDLPVIQYRIDLIEDLRPSAMDKTNADAFDEAHKDLVNMANRLTGR